MAPRVGRQPDLVVLTTGCWVEPIVSTTSFRLQLEDPFTSFPSFLLLLLPLLCLLLSDHPVTRRAAFDRRPLPVCHLPPSIGAMATSSRIWENETPPPPNQSTRSAQLPSIANITNQLPASSNGNSASPTFPQPNRDSDQWASQPQSTRQFPPCPVFSPTPESDRIMC